jgi:hypothetical protein
VPGRYRDIEQERKLAALLLSSGHQSILSCSLTHISVIRSRSSESQSLLTECDIVERSERSRTRKSLANTIQSKQRVSIGLSAASKESEGEH